MTGVMVVDDMAPVPRATAASWHVRALHAARPLWGDRVVRWTVLAGVLWLALYGLSALVAPTASDLGRLREYCFAMIPGVLTPVLLVVAGRRFSGRGQRALWHLLAASAGLVVIGNALDALQEFLVGQRPGLAGAASGVYIGAALLMPPALLAVGAGWRYRRLRAFLDASLLPVGLGALAWVVLIAPKLASQSGALLDAELVVYPLVDAAILGLVSSLLLRRSRVTPVWLPLVVAAVALGALGDACFALLSLSDNEPDERIVSLIYQADVVMMILSAVVAARFPDPLEAPQPGQGERGVSGLLAGLWLTLATMLASAHDGQVPLVTAGAASLAALVVAGRLVVTARENRDVTDKLLAIARQQEREAVADPLTGLHNRRFLDRRMAAELERSARYGHPVGVLLLDIDHFKQVNDRHGHATGDRVLCEIARRLTQTARPSDTVVRMGGEEFLVLVPEAGDLLALAERLRATISGTPIADLTITTSIGVASYPVHGVDAAGLLVAADDALYAAKHAGRDTARMAAMIPARRGAAAEPAVEPTPELPPSPTY